MNKVFVRCDACLQPKRSIAKTLFKYGEKVVFIAINCSLWPQHSKLEKWRALPCLRDTERFELCSDTSCKINSMDNVRLNVTLWGFGVTSLLGRSECVIGALVIRHAKRMDRIILSSVACQALPYFCTLTLTWPDFGWNNTKYKMCLFYFVYSVCLKHFSFQE